MASFKIGCSARASSDCGRASNEGERRPTGGSNEARTVSFPALPSTTCVMAAGRWAPGIGDGARGFDFGARGGSNGEWRVGGVSILPFCDVVSKSHYKHIKQHTNGNSVQSKLEMHAGTPPNNVAVAVWRSDNDVGRINELKSLYVEPGQYWDG